MAQNDQNISAQEFRRMHSDKNEKEKSVMSAAEWREMMKKKKTAPSKKIIHEIRLMLMFAKIEVVEEYRFHPERKWRFDFADVQNKIAIEYEGIFSAKSRHTTAGGYTGDIEKYNAAAKLGWTVLRYTARNYKDVIEDLKTKYESKFSVNNNRF